MAQSRYTLAGQRALVTGGSRSIGRAIALGLARCGAAVAINYHRAADAARSAVAEIESDGGRALAVRADVADPEDVGRMLDRVEGELGPVDILVNNAGVLTRTPFLEIAIDEWDRILRTNLRGYFVVGQAVARRMVRHGIPGRIVHIASTSSRYASQNLSHYAASKGGSTMLTRSMAYELADHGIRVNEVNPGLIETDMNRRDLEDAAWRRMRLDRIPLRRIGTPDDVVGAVLFLASTDAGLMTGASVAIDGGMTVI